jgi:hypothetical protein
MQITVFTSNQPRHIALIQSLSLIADRVYSIQECNTVFPGKVSDFFKKSEIMQKYFLKVIEAENIVFPFIHFLPNNVHQLPIKMGDINDLPLSTFGPALESDVYIVFGASYLKGNLCNELIKRQAINIHMGISPYYRGSSTNFWALYDKKPEFVGATIHRLTKGLDSGPILFHALPKAEPVDPFVLGMKAVAVAQQSLITLLTQENIMSVPDIPQNKQLEIRYTRNADFNDSVANEYLMNMMSPQQIEQKLSVRNLNNYYMPKMPSL